MDLVLYGRPEVGLAVSVDEAVPVHGACRDAEAEGIRPVRRNVAHEERIRVVVVPYEDLGTHKRHPPEAPGHVRQPTDEAVLEQVAGPAPNRQRIVHDTIPTLSQVVLVG